MTLGPDMPLRVEEARSGHTSSPDHPSWPQEPALPGNQGGPESLMMCYFSRDYICILTKGLSEPPCRNLDLAKWLRQASVQLPDLSLTSCVGAGKLFTFSVPRFPCQV